MDSDGDRDVWHSLVPHSLMFSLASGFSNKWAFLQLIPSHFCKNESIVDCKLDWSEVLCRVPGPGIVLRWVTSMWESVTTDRFPPPCLLLHAGDCLLPGPLAPCHRLCGSVPVVGRKKSAGVLQVCGPNWHVCEADYSCFGIGSETAWILWLISFSGKEAVTRISRCLGWVKTWICCSAGSLGTGTNTLAHLAVWQHRTKDVQKLRWREETLLWWVRSEKSLNWNLALITHGSTRSHLTAYHTLLDSV